MEKNWSIFVPDDKVHMVQDAVDAYMDAFDTMAISFIYELIEMDYDDEALAIGWKCPVEYTTRRSLDGSGHFFDFPPLIDLACVKKISQNYESDDKMVSHPDHYQSENGLEVIDVIEAFAADLKGIEATDTGNILKYACRWKKKNGIQDLKKIMWYTQHLINHLEKEN